MKHHICTLIISIILFSAFVYADVDTYKHGPGTWQLTDTQFVKGDGSSEFSDGKMSASCKGGSSTITWTTPPQTVTDMQEITMQLSGTIVETKCPFHARTEAEIEATSGLSSQELHTYKNLELHDSLLKTYKKEEDDTIKKCNEYIPCYGLQNPTLHYIMSGLTCPKFNEGESWFLGKPDNTLTYKFPSLGTAYICSRDSNNGLKLSEETVDAASRKENELKFNMTFSVSAGQESGGVVIYSYTWVPENKKEEVIIHGTVSSADKDPMPFINLQIELKGLKGKTFDGRTDMNGDFSIPITDIVLSDSEQATMYVTLDYKREGISYFKIFSLSDGSYKEIYYGKKFEIKDKQDVELHIVLDGSPDSDAWLKPDQPLSNMKHFSVMYSHFHQAIDFALKKLKMTFDYKLPINVLVGNTDKKTLYSPPNAQILISADDAGYGSTDRPDNREYHEFSHALMFDEYSGWPADRNLPNTTNHDGLLNPSTADSYLEGFAEFIPMVISKENGERQPNIYASFGSMEQNYHPWDGRGFDEEFAVASLLWDMYDATNDKGDSLTLSIEDMWSVLKVKRNNFYEYYIAFKQAFPKKANEIDTLFKEHGFFQDTKTGNKKWDAWEPIKDLNKNGALDANEMYIDLSALNSSNELVYRPELLVVGKAADYTRLNRTNAVRVPGAYLKVDDPSVTYYTIKVNDDYEYVSDVREGLVYVQPLPYDVQATITITPKSEAYTSDKPFVITATEMRQKLDYSKDSFDSHDFELKATGKKDKEGLFMAAPTYSYKGDIGEKIDAKIEDVGGKVSGKSENSFSFEFIWILLLLGLIGGGAFFVLKYAGRRKRN